MGYRFRQNRPTDWVCSVKQYGMLRHSFATKVAAIVATLLVFVILLNRDNRETNEALSRHPRSEDVSSHPVDVAREQQPSKQAYQPLLPTGYHPQRIATMASTPTTIMLISYPRMWPNNFYLVGLRQAGFQVTVVGHVLDPPGRPMAGRCNSWDLVDSVC